MPDKREEFSIAQWVWSIAFTAALTAIITIFYFRQFELMDALPYFGALAFIAGVSIWLTKYCDSPSDPFKLAAFCCKVFLWLVMAVNAAVCFSIGREMTVDNKEASRIADDEKRYSENLKEISKNAGRKGNYELSKRLNEHKKEEYETIQQIFKKHESVLFWLMVIEFGAAGLVAVIMLGLHAFRASTKPQQLRSDGQPSALRDDFPTHIDADARSGQNQPRFDRSREASGEAKLRDLEASEEASEDGLKRLQEVCSLIAFYNPGRWFAVDMQSDHVRV